MNKPDNISNNEWQLLLSKYKNLEEIIPKIKDGYPVQYLLGNTNFYGYDFNVTPDVLIPRYETETLIEKTIDYIKAKNLLESKCLDIGTGSGAIAITLKKEIDTLEVSALDISKKALEVAKQNALLNKVDINFIEEDIFKFSPKEKYDIIISNPPYIETNSNYAQNIKYEPKEAIFVSSEDPLLYYRHILRISRLFLNQKHLIAFEIDEDHGKEMQELAKNYYPQDKIILSKDLTGKDRYLFLISE